ncbi:MAG: nitrate/nitrite transporter NrtS [Phycisphaerales bacterium]
MDSSTSIAREWIRLALGPRVVRRAIGYAIVVGAILITINHGDAILRGEVTPDRWLKMGLTVTVPYLVSTFSSVGAMRAMMKRSGA